MKKIILSVIVAIMMVAMTTAAIADNTTGIGLNLESNLIYHPDWTMSISRANIGAFVPVPVTGITVGTGMSVASIGHFGMGILLWGGFIEIETVIPVIQFNFLAGRTGRDLFTLVGAKARVPIFPFSPVYSEFQSAPHPLFQPFIGYKYTHFSWGEWIDWVKKGPIAGIALRSGHHFSFWVEGQLLSHLHVVGEEWKYRWKGTGMALGVAWRF